MRRAQFLLALALTACQPDPTPTRFTTGGGDVPAEAGKTYRWTFDEDAAGVLPAALIDARRVGGRG